jgi:hypothetical protein
MSSKKKKSITSDFTKFLIGESEDSAAASHQESDGAKDSLQSKDLDIEDLDISDLEPESQVTRDVGYLSDFDDGKPQGLNLEDSDQKDLDSGKTIVAKRSSKFSPSRGNSSESEKQKSTSSERGSDEDKTLLKSEALKVHTQEHELQREAVLAQEQSLDSIDEGQGNKSQDKNEQRYKIPSSKPQSKIEEKSPAVVLSSNSSLLQAEQIRLVSESNKRLETENSTLKTENDRLNVEIERIKRHLDKVVGESESNERKWTSRLDTLSEEKVLLTDALRSKENQIKEFQSEVEDLKEQLTTDLKKLRVRERELENRIEMVKIEKTAVLQTKDQTILDLKRRIDQLITDIDSFKEKGKKLSDKLISHEERIQRSVRALRLALSNLEDDDNLLKIKKAD